MIEQIFLVSCSTGEPPSDLWEFDIARFSPHQANLRYLRDRAAEVLPLHYTVSWPQLEMESGRGIKSTPFHCRLEDAGAYWGCVNGWERPKWFSGSTECKLMGLPEGEVLLFSMLYITTFGRAPSLVPSNSFPLLTFVPK